MIELRCPVCGNPVDEAIDGGCSKRCDDIFHGKEEEILDDFEELIRQVGPFVGDEEEKYKRIRAALKEAQRVEERDAEKSPEEWASEFSALFCDGPLKYMIENEKCAEPHLDVPDDVARPLVEHIVRMRRTFARQGDEFNPDWMCKGECPPMESLKEHLACRAKEAQRVDGLVKAMKSSLDYAFKIQNEMEKLFIHKESGKAYKETPIEAIYALQAVKEIIKELQPKALREYKRAEGE